MMSRDPIKISRDDLMSEGVEGRLREQSTVKSTKDHYERAQVVAPQIAAVAGWRAWLLKSVVYLALFGLLGGAIAAGLSAWTIERPDRAEEASTLLADLRRIDRDESVGRYSAEQAQASRARVREIGRRNVFFVTADAGADTARLADPATKRSLAAGAEIDRTANSHADLIAFALAGFLIAAALAAADRVIERDTRGALLDAAFAGAIGVAAGVGVALLLPTIDRIVAVQTTATAFAASRVLGQTVAFALFGACVGAGPGVAIRSGRRTAAGAVGGLIGGAIGGLFFALIAQHLGGSTARFAAFALVGSATGLSMGWLEDAAKQGWLRVASGLIAGKQFILYRNPTFVGSAPMSHIYLFRDPQVGRRHAAIFQVTGGYEIENLPLGGPTLVNGQPISRVRLRRGDRIGVGRTSLVFDEKVAT